MTESADPAALSQSLGPSDVAAAAERIAGKVVRTPVLRCEELDAIAGASLFLKAENLQHIGAFKARGAMHAVGRLSDAERQLGVITYSSGNHAQAVALAARAYGVPATIAMPEDAPKIKADKVRALGAEVVFAGFTSDDRKKAALEIQARSGAPIVQPFDHPDIVCGAGTATAELHEQVAELEAGARLDALFVPVGGGGVLAGACLASRGSGCAIFTVEPEGCDSMARSLAAGERVNVTPAATIGDGLKPVCVGALNFEIARRDVEGSFHVDDEAMGRTLVRLLVRAKVLVEPSGAAGLAAALAHVPRLEEQLGRPVTRVGVMLTGGNVDPALVAELVRRYGAEV